MKSNIFNRTLPKCVLTFFAVLALTACSDYDNGYTEQQISFIQGFKDVFGEIDHTQDWNLAESGTVTVTTSQPSRIKIYANAFGTYKLVGNYEDVSGTQTLSFDILEGTTDILVSDGMSAEKVNLGESITFAGTRKVYHKEEEDGGDGINFARVTSTEKTYDEDGNVIDNGQVEIPGEYIAVVRGSGENGGDDGILPEGKQNYDYVTDNFSYVSNGEFTIYPIYMNSTSTHTLGIYWKGPNGELRTQEIYNDKDVADDLKDWQKAVTRPITIYLKEGTPFGMYLDVYYGTNADGTDMFQHEIFSEEELNNIYQGDALDGRQSIQSGNWSTRYRDVYAGTFLTDVEYDNKDENGEIINHVIDKNVMYLCFEDWVDYDYNDLIFVMRGAVPTIVDDESMPWILSCEDLGGSFDLDYNDVVIEVSHVNGERTATVTPLAAGGTLASNLYFYDGTDTNSKFLGEIHSFFGETGKTSGSYTPVNVSSTTPEKKAAPISIRVSSTWSIASKLSEYTDNDSRDLDKTKHNNMGGFYVKVIEKGKTEESDKDQIIQNVPLNRNDNVPYIICTPKIWTRQEADGSFLTGNYRWPLESVPMFEDAAFGNKDAAYHGTGIGEEYSFKAWIQGSNEKSKVWYAYPHPQYENTCAERLPYEGVNGTTAVWRPENKYLSNEKLDSYELTITKSSSGDGYDISYNGTVVKKDVTSITLKWSAHTGYDIHIIGGWFSYEIYYGIPVSGECEISSEDFEKIIANDNSVLTIKTNPSGDGSINTFYLSVE